MVIRHNKPFQLEGVSQAHEDLRFTLDQWAITEHLCVLDLHRPQHFQPDVYRCNETRNRLLVGDAKVAKNELPSKLATAAEIRRYFREFLALALEFDAGVFAIATDTQEAALAWKLFLHALSIREEVPAPFYVESYEGARIVHGFFVSQDPQD